MRQPLDPEELHVKQEGLQTIILLDFIFYSGKFHFVGNNQQDKYHCNNFGIEPWLYLNS